MLWGDDLLPALIAWPFWLAYGVLYGSGGDARWHECGHRTAFKTRWMNNAVYHLACFMMVRNPVTWRWSHARHHQDTIIVGRDPEIAIMRPAKIALTLLNFVGVPSAFHSWEQMLRNARGQISPDALTYIPESERPRLKRIAQVWTLIYGATLLACLLTMSLWPLMIIGLPRLYGAWHHVLTGLLQHGGLAENVLDHRQSTRTIMINPISRFIYMNMNYHIEHHMYPMVPYHKLPQLHEAISHDLPKPTLGFVAGYGELWRCMRAQMRGDFGWTVR